MRDLIQFVKDPIQTPLQIPNPICRGLTITNRVTNDVLREPSDDFRKYNGHLRKTINSFRKPSDDYGRRNVNLRKTISSFRKCIDHLRKTINSLRMANDSIR